MFGYGELHNAYGEEPLPEVNEAVEDDLKRYKRSGTVHQMPDPTPMSTDERVLEMYRSIGMKWQSRRPEAPFVKCYFPCHCRD